MSQAPITIGQVAARFGVETWQVRRCYERRLLPPAMRVGPYRVVPVEDLPKVEAALRQAGYLRRAEPELAGVK